MNKILIVCGPTASGKTALAARAAKELGSEVISADSMCVYKGFDIGTAKPAKEERCGVKHHMIDVCESGEAFSVADYKAMAEPLVQDLLKRGKIPVICGGTGFYVESILYDFSYGNTGKNDDLRKRYETIAQERGKEALFEILEEKDPLSAARLHPNDVKRVVRALEIIECGGRAKSGYAEERRAKYDYTAVCVDYDRKTLYERINARADAMFAGGLVEEVRGLLARGVSEHCQAMQGIGYKEVLDYLSQKNDLSQTIELVKRNSRRYAKRQITFFKRIENLVGLAPAELNTQVKEVLSLL